MNLTAKTVLPIFFTVLYAACLLLLTMWSKKLGLVVSGNKFITDQFNYQILLLLIAAISLFTTYSLNKINFTTYFSFGQMSAVGEELKLFGINEGDSWRKTGLSLCLVISLVTATFLYFQLKQINPDWAKLQSAVVWIILFSLTNSFAEEMIFRLGIVSPLSGQVAPTTIFLISALLFGIPHFAGMPNGIVGVVMAGILGFVLAKSMYETHGFFWAWTIHFLQDVLIFSTIFLMSESSQPIIE